jgi:hypothetical protein
VHLLIMLFLILIAFCATSGDDGTVGGEKTKAGRSGKMFRIPASSSFNFE